MFEYLMAFFMMMGFFGYGIIFVYPITLLSFPFELLGFDTSRFWNPFYQLLDIPRAEIIAIIFGNIVILFMIYFLLAVPLGMLQRHVSGKLSEGKRKDT